MFGSFFPLSRMGNRGLATYTFLRLETRSLVKTLLNEPNTCFARWKRSCLDYLAPLFASHWDFPGFFCSHMAGVT